MASLDDNLDEGLAVDPTLGAPNVDLRSTNSLPLEIPVPSGPRGGPMYAPVSSRGYSLAELAQIGNMPGPGGFAQPFQSISEAELSANQRYPVYGRGVGDLEDINAQTQTWYGNLGRGVVKFAGRAVGTFAQSLTNIPNTISAIKNGDVSNLSGDPDGYEGTIDNWINQMDNFIPTYQSAYAKEHPFRGIIPFTEGSSYFWGEKFLPNLGFMAGAVGGAIVQDVAIGAVTEGIGAFPLIGAQIGKASLYLNKLFAGSNDATKLLKLGTSLGKTEAQLFNLQRLAQLSAAAKVNTGFRYGMAIYGSSLTEAGVESREGYRKIKEELTNAYKFENLG